MMIFYIIYIQIEKFQLDNLTILKKRVYYEHNILRPYRLEA